MEKKCLNCGKIFTEEDLLFGKSEYYDKRYLMRDFKKRKFCCQKCTDNFHGRSWYHTRFETILKVGKCQVCGYNEFIDILEVHHIIERCNGGTDDNGNLILLCPNCHRKAHKKHITPDQLYNFLLEFSGNDFKLNKLVKKEKEEKVVEE